MHPHARMGLLNPTPSASMPPLTFVGVNASFPRDDVNSINQTSKKPAKDSPAPWSTSLCNCCEDMGSCCGVSGAVYGLILCMSGCGCLYLCFYRTELRGQYFLKNSPSGDCCVHCCGELCALCQEYRQLKKQGLDRSSGWHGNVERQKRLATKAEVPAVDTGMLH